MQILALTCNKRVSIDIMNLSIILRTLLLFIIIVSMILGKLFNLVFIHSILSIFYPHFLRTFSFIITNKDIAIYKNYRKIFRNYYLR